MCTIQIFKRFLFGKCLILLSTAVPAAKGPESVVAVVVTVGGHSSTLCWLFRLCWFFVDRRDRCWLKIPFRSEPHLILHETGEVALNKMVSTQCACWEAMLLQSAGINCTNFTHFRRTAVCFAGTSASWRSFRSLLIVVIRGNAIRGHNYLFRVYHEVTTLKKTRWQLNGFPGLTSLRDKLHDLMFVPILQSW